MGHRASVDILVVGAGPAGLAAAIAFRDFGARPLVIDTSKQASAKAARGRSAALFNKTVAFLQQIGVWDSCSRSAEPLRVLQFIDDTGRLLRAPDRLFDASEIGEAAFGYNIANADLMAAIIARAKLLDVPITASGPLVSFRETETEAVLLFEDGTEVGAPIVVAADGAASATRQAAGIGTFGWSYDQTAIATSFSHERLHRGGCIELHRSAGPFTLVPLPGNRSSLVWVERKTEAERLLALNDADFAGEVEKVSHLALGAISDVAERASFPLSFLAARELGRRRVALIGEAAHVAPPIGAQGLNLGFRDAQVLADLLGAAKGRGEDLGCESLLRAYSTARRGDILSRTLAIDVLNRSLMSSFLPFQAARGLGLYALGAIGPLRRAFMRRGIAPSSIT
jgi:2-octaprenyl-6-methoxyphenol hydroxylase